MNVHGESASGSHGEGIAGTPVQTGGLVFSDANNRSFDVEFADSGHCVAKYLCFEAPLVLQGYVAKFGAPNWEPTGCMCSDGGRKFPLVCATKRRGADHRDGA